jgi:eukaryotic-like serine/threonine-protein kinase
MTTLSSFLSINMRCLKRGLVLSLLLMVGCSKSIVMDPLVWNAPFHTATATLSIGKDVKIEMIWLESGEFVMGSPDSETGRTADEGPSTRVYLSGFWMSRTPVTQAQYQAVINHNPSRFKGSNRPVEQVSWFDAMEFCQSLSQMTGQTFTLPTEAQWEYACRAGSTTPFAFGECLDTDDANYDGENPLGECNQGNFLRATWPVDSGRANDWGLKDMHGNVWEWCLDWYDETYYAIRPTANPSGPEAGTWRVLRGGSFNAPAQACRSANRGYSDPESHIYIGFRIVLPA